MKATLPPKAQACQRVLVKIELRIERAENYLRHLTPFAIGKRGYQEAEGNFLSQAERVAMNRQATG